MGGATDGSAGAPSGAAEEPRGFVRHAVAALHRTYAVADLRTLGLFRLVLGFLLSADCVRHWAVASTFYSNEGVLSNHFQLFRPVSAFNFSVFHAFSSPAEVCVLFALQFAAAVCLFLGYRTRLAAVVSFVLVTSLDNRLVMVENGGYVVVNLLVLWAMFLPVGRRFSVDALAASYRERRERTVADLAAPLRPPRPRAPHVSIAAMLATWNVAFVYYFNVVNKSGDLWRAGATVHDVLFLNRMVTGLAVVLREVLPYPITQGLTWGVLALEASLFAWILWPTGRRVTRALAIAGMWALHGAFGVMMRLGPFSWFMIAWSFLLILPVHWHAMEARYRRRARPLVVEVARGSALAFALARLFARLDALELLRFEEGGSRGLFVAREEGDGGRVLEGPAALRAMAGALPAGRYLYPVAALATFGALGPLYRWASAHDEAVARFFGLRAPSEGGATPGAPRAPSPLARSLSRTRVRAREVFLAYFGVCALWQMLSENKSIPDVVKRYLKPPWVTEPAFSVMQATIQYPRLYQGWGMFSPNPITDDGTLAVEAWTIDGRRIDPLTGQEPDLDLTDARGLGLPQIWQDYFNRIRLDRNKPYREGLSQYLQRYHLRTGRPEDELVGFDVYWVKDLCPKPDEEKPTHNETIALLTWRKPKYVRPAGMPPLPPAPKVESAGD